jgi:putative flippase GtrA
MRSINREFYRFIFWGGVNTLAGYLIYASLLLFLPYLISYSIAFLVSVFISYFLNSKFVFSSELKLSKAIQFPLVYVVQYLLGTICLYLLVQILRVNQLLAPAVIVVLTLPLTFALSRRVVRGKREK